MVDVKKSKNRVKKRHTRWGFEVLAILCFLPWVVVTQHRSLGFYGLCDAWIENMNKRVCVCVYVQFNIKHVGQSLLGMLFDVCMLSCFRHVWLFATPWTVTHQAPLSMGFSRPEHWGGLPFPPPGDLPNPGIKPD